MLSFHVNGASELSAPKRGDNPQLRTFALIVCAHPYCARKFECHVMDRARALSTKGQMAIAGALTGFNDLGRSVTPTFLFRNKFNLQLSTIVQK